MNKFKKYFVKDLFIITLLGCVIISILYNIGSLKYLDQRISDLLYSDFTSINENIFVIGIDNDTLTEQGVWPMDRKVFADTINILNSDPENLPAVIGVDITFSGYTNPESDQALVDSVKYDNVVMACVGDFGGNFVNPNENSAYIDFTHAKSVSYPFKELKDVVAVGHTNAMYDTDGVLRRHLLYFDTVDGEHVESFPYQVYRIYSEQLGIEKKFTPRQIKDNFWRFRYDGKPGDYFSFSLQDVLDGDYDPELFKDAIVLIGPYDTGLTDDFITSADVAQNMYGVEYLANVTSSIIDNCSYYEIDNVTQYVFVLFICFIVTAFTLNKDIFHSVFAYLVMSLIGLIFSYFLYIRGYIIHPTWIVLGLITMFVLDLLYKYLQEIHDRKKITNIFERYVDPKILKELLKEGINSLGLDGKSTDIAVLFVDIRGFTTISEQLTPEEVVLMLDEYLTLTSDCIKKYEGTVDKFIGDCTMAFWGAPLDCQDSAYKACQAALDMVEKGEQLSLKLKERFNKDVNFGVGINYGNAVVGNIGSTKRMDYTAIGDTVNTASRLEANAPKGKIYISQSVVDELKGRCVVTPLENKIKLKGKTELFTVYTLDSLK